MFASQSRLNVIGLKDLPSDELLIQIWQAIVNWNRSSISNERNMKHLVSCLHHRAGNCVLRFNMPQLQTVKRLNNIRKQKIASVSVDICIKLESDGRVIDSSCFAVLSSVHLLTIVSPIDACKLSNSRVKNLYSVISKSLSLFIIFVIGSLYYIFIKCKNIIK